MSFGAIDKRFFRYAPNVMPSNVNIVSAMTTMNTMATAPICSADGASSGGGITMADLLTVTAKYNMHSSLRHRLY